MCPIAVIHLLENGDRRRWVFEWQGRHVVLQRYHLERGKGALHKLVEFFDSRDEGGYGDWKWLAEHEVPWDDELTGEVALAVVSLLRVRKPSDT